MTGCMACELASRLRSTGEVATCRHHGIPTGVALDVTVRVRSGGFTVTRHLELHVTSDDDVAAAQLAVSAFREAVAALEIALAKQEPLLPGHC